MADLGGKCLLARAALAKYVGSLQESSLVEKGTTLTRAAWLANPKGTVRDPVTNAAMFGVENLVTRPMAVAMDHVQSLVQSALKGGSPGQYRTVASTLTPRGVKTGASGVKKGLSDAAQYFKTGVDPRQVVDKFELREVTFKNPVVNKMVHSVFRLRGVPDFPFYESQLKLSLYGQARLRAIQQGMKGEAIEATAERILQRDITPEMMVKATWDAESATFRQRNAMGDFLSRTKAGARDLAVKAPKGLKLPANLLAGAIDLTIPFVKFASAATSTGLEYSPAGFVKAVIGEFDKNPAIEARFLKRMARASVGSVFAALAYAKARRNEMTGAYPENPSERAQWDLEGKKPYSMKVGDTWRSYLWLGPFAIPFVMGQAFGEPSDASVTQRAGAAVAGTAKSVTEQTSMTGLSNMLEAVQDPEQWPQVASSLLPIPSGLSQLASATDQTARASDGVGDRLKSKVPGLSRTLPPRLSQFGDTLSRSQSPASALFDFTNPSPAKTSPILEEFERLGINVTSLGKRVRTPSGVVTRSPREYSEILAEFGPVKRQMLERLIANPEYQTLSDDRKQQVLENVMQRSNRRAGRVDQARRSGVSIPKRRFVDFMEEEQ